MAALSLWIIYIFTTSLSLVQTSGAYQCSYPGVKTVPDEKDCACYYVCEKEEPRDHVCCNYGQWYSEKSESLCVNVGKFPTDYQNKCFLKMGAPGTTSNLEEVFIGRCYNYKLLVHAEFFTEQKVDCYKLFKLFVSAFMYKPACGAVNAKDAPYAEFIKAAHVSEIPRDKLLFWSSINDLSQSYSQQGQRLFTLENTFLGYLVDGLWWCGQEQHPGFNLETCPSWGICEGHPVNTFWTEASVYFAQLALGRATLMLDGSMPGKAAFRPNSFFGQYELPNLKCDDFKEVRIWVAHGLGLPVYEDCKTGSSLLELKKILTKRGCRCTCTDNPAEVLHLLCVDNPSAKECLTISPTVEK